MKERRKTRYFYRIAIVLFLIILLGGYIFYQTRDWIRGPELRVTSPVNGETFSQSAVRISGNAVRTYELTINGIKISSDQSGNFSEELLLAPGIHTLEIVARNRLGKEHKVVRQIVVK